MAPAAVLLRFGLLLAMLSITAGPAFAHSENGVAIDFVGGFTHPIFGPDHVVAMVAVGLWGAFLGVPAIWLLPVVFPLVMAIAGRTRRSGHAAAWCRNRDSAVSDRSWGHGGVRGKATAMGRSGPGRSLRRLSWPFAWHRASGRSGCHRLFDGVCHRDRHAARVWHRFWGSFPLAGWSDCRPDDGSCHCRDRLRLPGSLHVIGLLRAILPICLLVLATPAWAHSPIMGIGGVFGGMLHAPLTPEHGMSPAGAWGCPWAAATGRRPFGCADIRGGVDGWTSCHGFYCRARARGRHSAGSNRHSGSAHRYRLGATRRRLAFGGYRGSDICG